MLKETFIILISKIQTILFYFEMQLAEFKNK